MTAALRARVAAASVDEDPAAWPTRPVVVSTQTTPRRYLVMWRGPRGRLRYEHKPSHRVAVRFATDIARLPEKHR